jgi:hypothetical protein
VLLQRRVLRKVLSAGPGGCREEHVEGRSATQGGRVRLGPGLHPSHSQSLPSSSKEDGPFRTWYTLLAQPKGAMPLKKRRLAGSKCVG